MIPANERTGAERVARLRGLAQAVLFAGAVLVFWPGGHDQFVLPKVLFLLTGVSLFATVLLATARVPTRAPAGGWDRTLLALMGLFAVWSLVVPAWGAANRELHLIEAFQQVLLCGLVLCVGAADGGARMLRRNLRNLGLPVVAVGVLAVLQGTGIDPFATAFHLQSARGGRWRVLTTLGNPGWTAELLAVGLPLVLAGSWILLESRRRWLVAVAATTLVTAGIAVTGSRTGLLAAAIGLGVTLTMASRESWRRGAARASAIGLAVLLVGSLLAAWGGVSRWTKAAPVTGRASLWAAGGELALKRPVTGWGLGHTRLELPHGLQSVVERTPPDWRGWLPTTLVDRFDNDWLQCAVEGGMPAAVLLLGIWGRAAWNSVRYARREKRIEAASVGGSLVGLGACSLISAPLHTPATAVMFWILVGTCARSGDGDSKGVGRTGRRWIWVGVCLTGALAAAGAVLSARVLPANEAAGRGRALLRAGRPAEAVALLERGAATVPWIVGVHADLADAYNETGRYADALAVTLRGDRWSASERLWAARAVALARLGYGEEARLVLRQGLAVLPGSKLLGKTRRALERVGDGTGGEAAEE